MKKLIFSFLFLFIFSVSYSQQLIKLGKKYWNVDKVSVAFGSDFDMIKLDHDYFFSTLRDADQYDFTGVDFGSSDLESAYCDNSEIRLTAALSAPSWNNTELRFSIISITDRQDGLKYRKGNEFLNIDGLGDELGIESTILKRFALGRVRFYGGVGTNLGYSYNNRVSLEGQYNIEDIPATADDKPDTDDPSTTFRTVYLEEDLRQKNGINQRIFVHAGIGLMIGRGQRWEIGFQTRKGIGYRWINGTNAKMTRLTSNQIVVSYHL